MAVYKKHIQKSMTRNARVVRYMKQFWERSEASTLNPGLGYHT